MKCDALVAIARLHWSTNFSRRNSYQLGLFCPKRPHWHGSTPFPLERRRGEGVTPDHLIPDFSLYSLPVS
jgi:hypothetical protein